MEQFMDPIQIIAAGLCVVVGISLGLLGGGGSVLMVPLFVYLAKVPVNQAIAMSLLIVGLSSAAGSLGYIKKGCVNKRLVILFILPGIFASFYGGRAALFFSSEQLLLMFGGLMLCISIVLYRKTATTPNTNESITCHPNFTLSTAVGTVIGFLTGLLGVGGGFLIVPAIALLMRCSFCTAIGTSLAIIAINSLAGFMGHLSTTKLNLPLSAVFLVATLSGAVFGAKFSNKCSIPFLHKAFVILIFLVSLFVIAQQIHFF